VIAVLATGALAAVGFALGSSGDDDPNTAASFSNSASAGTTELRFPGGWMRASHAIPVPGITFDGPKLNLAPSGSDRRTGLAAGQVNATGPRLLPESFLRRLGGRPPSGTPVELGDLEALRYSNLRPKGYEGKLTLLTVPTTAGVATIACAAPAGTPESVTDQCEQIATTLRLVKAHAFPLGPQKGYADALNQELKSLNEARKTKLKQGRDAKTPDEQASVFDALAHSYRAAANRLDAARVSPAAQPANQAIVGALHDGERAYSAMAGAARSNANSSYVQARAAARQADAQLEAALDRLGNLGYEVRDEST
jgi:hypothetical protein